MFWIGYGLTLSGAAGIGWFRWWAVGMAIVGVTLCLLTGQRIGIWAFCVFLCQGCVTAPLAIGLVLDGTIGGIGIWQRAEHQQELKQLTEQVYRLRVPLRLPTAEILREGDQWQ